MGEAVDITDSLNKELYDMQINYIKTFATSMRKEILKMALRAGSNGAHVGPALSLVEVLAVLYGSCINFEKNDPTWSGRDRVYLSKGHGALAYYAALHEIGFLSQEDLDTYDANGGILPAQPSMNLEKGIEFSSGSLGLGLSPAIGSALAAKSRGLSYRTYAILGNGECNEGTVWEAAMSAPAFQMDNLVAIIDNNGIQSDGLSTEVLDMGDLERKWEAFGWLVRSVDGHDIEALLSAFSAQEEAKPLLIIAKTVKGKGVSFMEHNKEWHHNLLTPELYQIAMAEQEVLNEA